MHPSDPTNAEIFRRLVDLDERHSQDLSDIKRQVQVNYGQTVKLEARVEGHDRELRDLKRGPVVPPDQPLPPELRELLDLARDAKGVARVTRWIWAIGAALVPVALWWAATGGKVWP